MNKTEPTRRLHIGGTIRVPGWEVLNANPAPYVDHVCNAKDLSQFADSTFNVIYASHVLEHFDYVNELLATLTEWNRVLTPGGKLVVSVPDLDILCRLMLEKQRLDVNTRYLVMRMMFGGHVDQYDYHVVGLNEEFLAAFLLQSGFVNFRRMKSLDIFDDTSKAVVCGIPISLNVIAEKQLTDADLPKNGKRDSRNELCFCGSDKKYKNCHGKDL